MMNWEKRQHSFVLANRLLLTIYVLVTLYVLWQGIKDAYGRAELYSVVALVVLLIPISLEKLLKIMIPADSRFFYYLFCFGAVEFGSAMDGYDLIPWWDLFLHALSGSLIGLVGLIIFNALRQNHGQMAHQDIPLMVLFVNFAATTSAALWEYYEFVLDTFFGFDAQIAASGVSDTMTDMMVCTLGGIIISFLMYRHYTSAQGKGLLMQTIDHYYYRNQAKGRSKQ